MLTIHNQTRAGKILNALFSWGYGGVIFFLLVSHLSMIIIRFPIDLCMRDKKEFAIVLSIAVEMVHFMKKSSNL